MQTDQVISLVIRNCASLRATLLSKMHSSVAIWIAEHWTDMCLSACKHTKNGWVSCVHAKEGMFLKNHFDL